MRIYWKNWKSRALELQVGRIARCFYSIFTYFFFNFSFNFSFGFLYEILRKTFTSLEFFELDIKLNRYKLLKTGILPNIIKKNLLYLFMRIQ